MFVFAYLGTNEHFPKKIEIGASHEFPTLAPLALPPRPLVSILILLIHDLNRTSKLI